ncbi:MAG: pyrimidine-specific ribonucleoside hydrolase RihA [Lachnospiraceae bacterium]|nr:pyrimidine-specific ribonucleoside hydrolase RihA [Lachnospiraceae bacterium]
MSKRIPIIIDCDPGHDDAMAILWALASPQLELKAVTTVAGNQTIEKVTTNAIKVLTKARRLDIPVAMGAKDPLMRKLVVGGEVVHGDSGLEGPILPDCGFAPSDLSAVELLIKTIEESDDKITLVPIGPLTNIAKLFLVRPDLKEKIERLSIMGGGAYMGNWTPAAEYNIWADPEAAKIVFNSGLPIIMSGLDVTHKAYITREENEILRAQGNEISIFAAELIDYFSRYHYEVEGFPGCTMHDPTAIAALLYPEIFTGVTCNVDVETKGELTTGMTVVDTIDYKEKIFGEKADKNTTVLFNVDRKKYVEAFFAAMKSLN